MPINPTGADVQARRRVELKQLGGPTLKGELTEVRSPDMRHAKPYAMVLYTDMRMPVATDMEKLDWE